MLAIWLGGGIGRSGAAAEAGGAVTGGQYRLFAQIPDRWRKMHQIGMAGENKDSGY